MTPEGAVITLTVGVSRNRRVRLEGAGFAVPPDITIRAAIDTGSYILGLSSALIQALDLRPFRTVKVRTPSTRPGEPCRAGVYDVGLTLLAGDQSRLLPSVMALAFDDFTPGEGVQGIVGRNVLDLCVFTYYGTSGQFSLAF